MTESALPPQVRDFICDRIQSIEQLEALLLVRHDANRTWCARDIARELNISESSAEGALQQLESEGLMLPDGAVSALFRYAPRSSELGCAVEQLASLYPRCRVEIVMLVSRCAMERIRTAQLRVFAQAFLLRTPKKPSH